MIIAVIACAFLFQIDEPADISELERELNKPSYQSYGAASETLKKMANESLHSEQAKKILRTFDADAVTWLSSVGNDPMTALRLDEPSTIRIHSDKPLKPESVRFVFALRHLRVVSMNGEGITDDHLLVLSGIPSITTLDINGSCVKGTALASMKLPRLSALHLSNCPVGDDEIAAMPDCDLKILDLRGTKVTDKGISLIQNKGLLSLNVSNTSLTPVGASQIGQFDRLELLKIDSKALDEAVVSSLATKLKSLRKVVVYCDPDNKERATRMGKGFAKDVVVTVSDNSLK